MSRDVQNEIAQDIKSNPILLYMKGTPASPQCGFSAQVVRILESVPLLGDPVERFLAQIKEGVKAGLHGGMLFEELGLRYLGPIDGHNVGLLKKYLQMVKDLKGPILLHVVTEKGHGYFASS